MANPQTLPAQDDASEDTLSTPLVPMSDTTLRTLLKGRPESLLRGSGRKLTRPPDRHITCSESLADAIIEDRG